MSQWSSDRRIGRVGPQGFGRLGAENVRRLGGWWKLSATAECVVAGEAATTLPPHAVRLFFHPPDTERTWLLL